jgi:cytosine permease
VRPARTADVSLIVSSSAGLLGVLVIVSGTVKLNDWNLYSAGLSFVNSVSAVFAWNAPRRAVTASLGIAGTVLAAFGILGNFAPFVIVLGLALPPVCGIIVAEYFVVRRWRPLLDEARKHGVLPPHSPDWVPASLVIWLPSALLGNVIPVGFASGNAILLAFGQYIVAARLGLLRGVGVHTTIRPTAESARAR